MDFPRRARLGVGVAAAVGALLVTSVTVSQPAFANSGNKCTSTTHTSTCINITGTGLTIDDIFATHHNDNPTSTNGRFELIGPAGLVKWSPVVNYAGGHNAQYTYVYGRSMAPGTYCVQWFVGTSGGAETGRACADVHA